MEKSGVQGYDTIERSSRHSRSLTLIWRLYALQQSTAPIWRLSEGLRARDKRHGRNVLNFAVPPHTTLQDIQWASDGRGLFV